MNTPCAPHVVGLLERVAQRRAELRVPGLAFFSASGSPCDQQVKASHTWPPKVERVP